MRMHAFIAAAVVLNVAFANVCLAGTTYAAPRKAGPPISFEVPISYNVVTCPWIKTDDGWRPAPDSPCASGHCMKKEKPDTRCTFTSSVPTPPVETQARTVSIPLVAFMDDERPAPPRYHEPPPHPGLATIVLRT